MEKKHRRRRSHGFPQTGDDVGVFCSKTPTSTSVFSGSKTRPTKNIGIFSFENTDVGVLDTENTDVGVSLSARKCSATSVFFSESAKNTDVDVGVFGSKSTDVTTRKTGFGDVGVFSQKMTKTPTSPKVIKMLESTSVFSTPKTPTSSTQVDVGVSGVENTDVDFSRRRRCFLLENTDVDVGVFGVKYTDVDTPSGCAADESATC